MNRSDSPREEHNHYWQTVIQTMQDGLMVVDTEGMVVSVNPVMEKITGYSAEELIGAHCSILGCDSCSDVREGEMESHCELFRTGAIRRCKCTLRKKDGTPLHVLKNAAVIEDGAGGYLGGVETLTDLSEVVARDREIADLRRVMTTGDRFEGLIGRSPAMVKLFNLISSAAQSEAPILIYGESGTGKEMVADALHRLGPRSGGSFIKVNCAALNEALLESELFGHVKGAFTGADRNRTGRFEAARGGDFLLDEVGDLPASTQVKLLRVLQEKVIERVGDHQPIEVDVRIISATNKDLAQLVKSGRFREDLFYRVAVIPIRVPSLRERLEDVPLLVEDFIGRLSRKTGKPITGLSRQALAILLGHPWPGNVRELINALEFAFVLCPEGLIQPDHLPETLTGHPKTSSGQAQPTPASGQGERERILEALRQTNGKKQQAAQLLGISRVTLWKKIKDLDIQLETKIN